ncbi:hypothetical protein [Nocardioides sp.]|uniref:hypothetical protein n=1 Tax=Nocardioides sp. TaxID=35761 RepID=UPI003511E798
MALARTTQVLIDESKAKSYLMVTAAASPSLWAGLRADLSSMVMPGQRSLHMKSESEGRRIQIADRILSAVADSLVVDVIDAGRIGTERTRRARCLETVVDLAFRSGGAHLIIDRDLGLQQFDRQQLIEAVRGRATDGTVTYEHRSRHEDPGLAVPDAIAWAWARNDQ